MKLIQQSMAVFLSWCLVLVSARGGFAYQTDSSTPQPAPQAALQSTAQLDQLVQQLCQPGWLAQSNQLPAQLNPLFRRYTAAELADMAVAPNPSAKVAAKTLDDLEWPEDPADRGGEPVRSSPPGTHGDRCLVTNHTVIGTRVPDADACRNICRSLDPSRESPR